MFLFSGENYTRCDFAGAGNIMVQVCFAVVALLAAEQVVKLHEQSVVV